MRRTLDLHSLAAVREEVANLHRAGYEKTGQWDLAMICDHVGEGMKAAMGEFPRKAPWIIRKLFGPMILKRILADRRMKTGIKVPKWWLPQSTRDESTAVRDFMALLSRFDEAGDCPGEHPFFGRLPKSQWTELVCIHAGHHLSFLRPRVTA
jgi:hypothetical protein